MEEKRKWSRRRTAIVSAGAVLLVLLVLMAIGLECGGSRSEQPAEKKGERQKNAAGLLREQMAEDEDGMAGAPETKTPSGTTGARTRVTEVPAVQAKTIRTGTLTIEIARDTFGRSYSRVSLIAEGVGGHVSDSRSDASDGRITSGTITVRIPNESFFEVMEELKKLGKVTSISEQSQDVTDEYVDLESRLNNLRAQEAVYLNLMRKAQTIEESISVQRELGVVQGQIEQLTGRKNYLDNHVGYSTIQVTLSEPGAVVSESEGWGFVKALSDAAHGVVDGINEVIRFAGNALIYILIVVILTVTIYALVRRRRRKGAEAGSK